VSHLKYSGVLLILIFGFLETQAMAQAQDSSHQSSSCSEMEVFDFAMGMCMPLPMAGMPMQMLMLRGNSFLTGVTESGPRGREGIAIPNMLMIDLGESVGDSHYFNVEYMGTFERWTFPERGYPELFQIGEENLQGEPFLDAQHPHSSPTMGLTLSDTISLGDGKNHIKIFAAPRGEATDGPVAFMHRPTGMVNPDAPLGHHIGQDVGHLTSSVVGESLQVGKTHYEASVYHGAEPSPESVDLPLGKIDSYSVRLIQELSEKNTVMVSYGYVSEPESSQPDILFERRYSASFYSQQSLEQGWDLDNALIYGNVTNYDHSSSLTSLTEEFYLHSHRPSQYWGRLEVLQRTPEQLEIQTSGDFREGLWLGSLTLGYSNRLKAWESSQLNAGMSLTSALLPSEFQSAYGGNPWSGKVFLQLSGMKMWEL
jgi:hypothetical protein